MATASSQLASKTDYASAASPILDDMRSQAASLLGSALGTTPMVSFATGANGAFPYYWQNPANLLFNANTYNWINTNLAANSNPVQQDTGAFTNEYITALGSISYSLSSADQAALVTAQQNATNQQAALLTAWKSAYGSIPTATATQQPIDIIVSTICNTWASPPTTLSAIQTSSNLNKLLNNTPASGKTVLPALSNWVNALGASVSLQNAVSMNNGYLGNALTNVQTPATSTGGLQLDNSSIVPAYKVATQLSDILNGLGATSNKVSINMSASYYDSTQTTVSMSGHNMLLPTSWFFGFGTSNDSSYYQNSIMTSSNSVSIDMSFGGVTLVQYGPTAFNAATNQGWFYMDPITQSIASGAKDISGYKFSPDPNIDFSANGPFGILQGVAICNYPTITITVKSSNYQSIATEIKSSSSFSVSFLGITLASGSKSSYQAQTTTDASSSTVTITLSAPTATVGGSSTSSTAWILGVQTNYPAA